MIGLEGSGFTICLGVILLLTGVVMYYCKSKIAQCEGRINKMVPVMNEIQQELIRLRQQQSVGHTVIEESIDEDVKPDQPEEKLESDSEESDSEESETKETRENNLMSHPYQELIPSTPFTNNQINESSESEDDSENESTGDIKVVDLGKIEDLEEVSEESEEEEETTIDYTKLQVSALKKLASERKLATNINKLRKQELVSLLQSQ